MPKRAPKKFHLKAKQFYSETLKCRELEPDEHPVFEATCENLSLFYKLSDEIEQEGYTFVSANGVVHKNPLLSERKNAWTGFLSGLRLLKFDEAEIPKRPGRPSGLALIGG
jgi:hypothetical protein